jgi:hypothetical protein
MHERIWTHTNKTVTFGVLILFLSIQRKHLSNSNKWWCGLFVSRYHLFLTNHVNILIQFLSFWVLMHMVYLHLHIVPSNGIWVNDVIHDFIHDLISPIPKTHSHHPSPILHSMSSTPTRSLDRKMVLEHPRVHIF